TAGSFLLVNALGLGVAATFWAGVELALGVRWAAPGPPGEPALARSRFAILRSAVGMPPFAHFAANVALALRPVAVGVALASGAAGARGPRPAPLAWAAALAVGAALAVSLWDAEARFPLLGLYSLGLAAVGLGLHLLHPGPEALGWDATLAL